MRKQKKLYPNPGEVLFESETKARIGKKPFRKTLKISSKNKILLQVCSSILFFTLFYVYVTTHHSSNALLFLIAFTLLYVFTSTILFGSLIKFLSGEHYSFGVIFSEFFFVIGIMIGTFSALYLPILLILFASEKSGEWLRYALTTALVVAPLSYIFSVSYEFLRKEGYKIREIFLYFRIKKLRREELKKETQKVDIFYEKIGNISENYKERISRTLTREDIIEQNKDTRTTNSIKETNIQ